MNLCVLQGAALVLLVFIASCDSACTYHARLRREVKSQNNVREKRTVTCDSTDKYRSYDGTCNNLDNPTWGSVGTPFLRWLDPQYANASSGTPRESAISGNALPHPRDISNTVHFELSFTPPRFSAFLMQWGQFIDHDITKTPVMDDDIDCCDRTDSVPSDVNSPCFPIHLNDNDTYFDDGKCMNFVRSADEGSGSVREQYNSLSAFIDASMVYGVDETELNNELKDADKPYLLKVEDQNMLPTGDNSSCFYDDAEPEYNCFLAGDARVNVFHGLTALHTLFLREHNRIAEVFKTDTDWDDNKIFEETRRIIAAEMQIITYNEWLPEIIGTDAIDTYTLNPTEYSYDSNTNPSLSNVFAGAAFRFGHSMVSENYTIGDQVVDTSLLFKRTKYVHDSVDDVISGLATTKTERADAWYADGMRNQMFEQDSAAKDGLDIVALNIQRGRDHGLPPYNDWREFCGLYRITEFSTSAGNESDFGVIQGRHLELIYESVDDIDLYSGGISEAIESPSQVGVLYTCLMGKQFQKLRDGDRFWYRSTDENVKFSDSQIAELEERRLSHIICDNTEIAEIQKNVFRQTGTSLVAKPCSMFKNKLDLSLFTA